MLKRFLVLIAFLSAGNLGVANAADVEGQFAVEGAGSRQCKHYSHSLKNKDRDMYVYLGWLDGYVSGFNHLREDTFDITPWQTTEMLAILLDKICQQKPDIAFFYGASQLIKELYPYRLTRQSTPIEIKDGEKGIFLYQETIIQMQNKLASMGHLRVHKSGEYDEATAAALSAFQKDRSMPVSGFPEQTTLFQLFFVPDNVNKS